MKQSIPESVAISTYAELMKFGCEFAKGTFTLLIIYSQPGLGKSQMINQVLDGRLHVYINSHATPLAFYEALYRGNELPVVLDDVDSLMGNRCTAAIMKAACDTGPVRSVSWASSRPTTMGATGEIPTQFTLTSQVCLLANRWTPSNPDLVAIHDRALAVEFVPTFEEIHRRAGCWFKDEEVYQFIGANYCLASLLSFRTYIKAQHLRECRPARWRNDVLTLMGIDEKARTFVAILDSEDLASEEQRAAAFEAAGLGSRNTYFRWKRRYAEQYGRQSIKVSPDSAHVLEGVGP